MMFNDRRIDAPTDMLRDYQELLDRLYQMETIAAIREGIESAERGELKPAEQVFAEMKAKYGIHG